MAVSTFNAAGAPSAVGPYSHGATFQNILFLSGQLGIDPTTGKLQEGFIAQAEQVLKNLGAVLAGGKSDYTHVLKCTVFLKDFSNFAAFNALYEKTFAPHKPARTSIGVAALPMGAEIEIEAIAVAKS